MNSSSSLRSDPLHNLNVDVLLYIADFPTRDALSMLTRTCRSLYETLACRLLKGTVSVNRVYLSSFQSFIYHDHERISYLRDFSYQPTLYRDNHKPSPLPTPNAWEAGKTVMKILRDAPNIVAFHLPALWPTAFPPKELRATLACMERLERIHLATVTHHYADVLRDIPSSLRAVQFDFFDQGDFCRDPTPFLRNHRATIRELSLCAVELTGRLDSFPQVRVLALKDVHVVGSGSILMRLFPNAVEVTIDGVYPYSGVNARSRLSAYRDFRNQQNVLDVSPAERLQSWGRLRRVRGGSALEVHWLGFRSRVPHLDITIPKHFYGSITLVLQYAQPRWLTLRMPDPDCVPPTLEADPPTSSGPQGRPGDLTHLIMRIPRGNCSRCGLKGVFNRLSRLLERSSISHLLLELYSEPSDIRCAGDPVFELMAREVDECHGEYVRLLGQTVASLRRVFLDVEDIGFKAWERVPEPHQWREWSENVGRTLVVAEMDSR